MKQILPTGRLCITAYPGHPGGDAELDMARKLIRNLDSSIWKTMEISFPNQKDAPVLLLSERRVSE